MWFHCAGRYLNCAGHLQVGAVEALKSCRDVFAVAAHADAAWLRSRYAALTRRNCGNGGRYGIRCRKSDGRAAVVWPAPDYATVADSVRSLFRYLGLDPANPLGRWIQPGMTVVVKPNWVKHEFGETEGRNVLFTHASLVRALIDAALAALAGKGRVFVADAPLQGSDFARFRRQSGLAELERDYAGAPVAFLDLRQQWAEIDDASSYVRGYIRSRAIRTAIRSWIWGGAAASCASA